MDKRLNKDVDQKRSKRTRTRASRSREVSSYRRSVLINVAHRLPKPHMIFRGSISAGLFSEAMNRSGLNVSGCE